MGERMAFPLALSFYNMTDLPQILKWIVSCFFAT